MFSAVEGVLFTKAEVVIFGSGGVVSVLSLGERV